MGRFLGCAPIEVANDLPSMGCVGKACWVTVPAVGSEVTEAGCEQWKRDNVVSS